MPFGDRTGPQGTGPMTGRGTGYCAGSGRPGFAGLNFGRCWFGFNRGPERNTGRGRGFGRGSGQGMGRGMGRSMGGGMGRGGRMGGTRPETGPGG